MSPVNNPNWELVFSDEFSASQLNTSTWSNQYYYGGTNEGNNNLSLYTPDSLIFGNGQLKLRASKQPTQGERVYIGPDGQRHYTTETFDYRSGMIAGHNKRAFTYGYMEFRAKFPAGKGFWGGFWMIPQKEEQPLQYDERGIAYKRWPPEIDVVEVLGQDPTTGHSTLHYPDSTQPYNDGMYHQDWNVADLSQGFHTFGVQWLPSQMIWYVDNQPVFQVSQNIPNEPMYLLANLAVGGTWPGDPDSTTPFPSSIDIDYIRVYQNTQGTLHGGDVNDTLQRKNGNLSGEAGNDTLTISEGGSIYGGDGKDLITGGYKDNRLSGDLGDDQIVGREGNDTVLGGAGNDTLTGSIGNDKLSGGGGNDTLCGTDAATQGEWEYDVLQGDAGSDTFLLGNSSGAYYKFHGDTDLTEIKNFGVGDKVVLSSASTYLAQKYTGGFALFVVGGSSNDLIMKASTSLNLDLPQGNFQISAGQTLANVFVGV